MSGVFRRDTNGKYIQGNIAKIAATLCYRVAQAQAFLNGNKRTAYMAAKILLERNHFKLNARLAMLERLIRGFAEPQANPEFREEDAKAWFESHVTFVYNRNNLGT